MEGQERMSPEHPWTSIAHYYLGILTLLFFVTVDMAILAGGFVVAECTEL